MGARAPRGEGIRPPLDATVRHAQAQRICHRRLPTRLLAERAVCSPPKGLGLGTSRPGFALSAAAARHHFQTLDFLAHGIVEDGVAKKSPYYARWRIRALDLFILCETHSSGSIRREKSLLLTAPVRIAVVSTVVGDLLPTTPAGL